MELILDNDLTNVVGGTSDKETEFSNKCSIGAHIGEIVGGIVGSCVGATQFRKYVLNKGKKSSSFVGCLIYGAVDIACSSVGAIVGFAAGALASM